jgi:septation ring formation regulator EzrA
MFNDIFYLVLGYGILSILSILVIYFLKKKSDKELKVLEESQQQHSDKK